MPGPSFIERLEWRSPLFHYDPRGRAVAAMTPHVIWEARPQSPPVDVDSLTKPQRRAYERFEKQQQTAVRTIRDTRIDRFIGKWEYTSSGLSIWPGNDNMSSIQPLVSLERERDILEIVNSFVRSEEVERYVAAGFAWGIPEGNLTIALADGTVWVDRSGDRRIHKTGKEEVSAFAHFSDSMDERAQLPSLAAVLMLAPNTQETKILHVASSYGLAMKMMELVGYEHVTGIDIDEHAVRFAQNQDLDTRVMYANQMDFPDESFDIIISRDFLCRSYVPYPQRREEVNRIPFYNEQFRVVRKGGFVIFTRGLCSTTPLDDRDIPVEELLASNLANAQRMLKTGLVLDPMGYEDAFYPIWIFQK